MITEESAFSQLEPHLRRIWACYAAAFEKYRADPYRHLHRKATRANLISDLVFAEVVSEFDEVPGVTIVQSGIDQMRYLSISESLNLWFKKLDDARNSANYPTRAARRRDRGQESLFGEEPSLILAGYQLTTEETSIKCLSFSPPKFVKPRWWFDIFEMKMPIVMHPTVNSAREVRLMVKRSSQQLRIG
jgi:hypothetical protein